MILGGELSHHICYKFAIRVQNLWNNANLLKPMLETDFKFKNLSCFARIHPQEPNNVRQKLQFLLGKYINKS